MALLPAGRALAAATPVQGSAANVTIGSAIVLSALTGSFTLAGSPGDSPVGIGVVTMDVFANNATGYLPLSDTAATTVYTQATPSAATPGDALSNDYEFSTPIPNVIPDTYSVTLNYIATTNP